MSIEAMKLALEALEEATTYTSSEAWSPSMTRDCEAAAVAIRQAIEQAQTEANERSEVEPVACQYAKDVAMPEYKCVGKCQYDTSPPQRQPLTDEQIEDITADIHGLPIHVDDYAFARAIEAAHGIKGEA